MITGVAASYRGHDEQAQVRQWWLVGGIVLMIEVVVLFAVISWSWLHDSAAVSARSGSRSVVMSPGSMVTSVLPSPRHERDPRGGEPARSMAPRRVQLPADDQHSLLPEQPAAIEVFTPAPRSPLTRLVIPSIGVDRGVESVAPYIENDTYGPVQLWPVPNHAVGHHADSGLPGDGTNIVLTGHVGGSDPVFHRLIDLKTGDLILLYQETRVVTYTVATSHLLQEGGVSLLHQQENAQVLDPTPIEVVTVITCWPPTGPHAYDQRVVVRAVPVPGGQDS